LAAPHLLDPRDVFQGKRVGSPISLYASNVGFHDLPVILLLGLE
jgi:hypothetical protein